MVEWSKAPDSRLSLAPLKGISERRDFWSSYEGRGSNSFLTNIFWRNVDFYYN
jgi:hypothetical protein